MKRLLTVALILSSLSAVLVGCMEKKSTSKTETKITTPGGSTTITTEREIKKTGDNAPGSP